MSTKLNIIDTLENSTKKPIVFLMLIGLGGLFLRLVYFPYDIPLFDESLISEIFLMFEPYNSASTLII